MDLLGQNQGRLTLVDGVWRREENKRDRRIVERQVLEQILLERKVHIGARG
jgi:hypothetical protein